MELSVQWVEIKRFGGEGCEKKCFNDTCKEKNWCIHRNTLSEQRHSWVEEDSWEIRSFEEEVAIKSKIKQTYIINKPTAERKTFLCEIRSNCEINIEKAYVVCLR